tara:strand:+ start:11325 stop:11615 length:291 start_codon:yes stop_codon:yes gene_type:complete
MMTYLVIGICLLLLIIVVYIAAKPISMGIEARRNIKDASQENEEDNQDNQDDLPNTNEEKINKVSISDEIIKLNDLKKKGLITEEEYEKAKDKLLD